jgi:hypothetical protein
MTAKQISGAWRFAAGDEQFRGEIVDLGFWKLQKRAKNNYSVYY